MAARGRAALSTSGEKQGNKSCRANTCGDASSPDLRARAHGHALATGLAPDRAQLLLEEAYGDEESRALAGKDLCFRWVQRASPTLLLETHGAAGQQVRVALQLGSCTRKGFICTV
jgi:hypothetical protein